MRRMLVGIVLSAAAVAAGCGSSSSTSSSKVVTKTVSQQAPPQTPNTPTTTSAGGSSGMSRGSTGSMGPPRQGETTSTGQYDLRKRAVLEGLGHSLLNRLVARGDKNLDVSCTNVDASTASCTAKGMNAKGESFSVKFRVDVNTQTGNYTVSNVQAA